MGLVLDLLDLFYLSTVNNTCYKKKVKRGYRVFKNYKNRVRLPRSPSAHSQLSSDTVIAKPSGLSSFLVIAKPSGLSSFLVIAKPSGLSSFLVIAKPSEARLWQSYKQSEAKPPIIKQSVRLPRSPSALSQ